MTANPVGRYGSNDYCSLEEVQARLYSGQGQIGATTPPVDATRDALLSDLITQRSRDFDEAVWGNLEYPGLFSWRLETRLYSGVGQQDLHVGPFASIAKVEIDATPGQLQSTFQDYTIEFGQHRMGIKPIRGYPKGVLFRQATFYVDPFRLGNVRLTGIWGIVQPSDFVAPPNQDWEDEFLDGITTNAGAVTVASLAPTNGVWWATPDDVRGAVAAWVVHSFQNAKSGYGTSTGTGAAKFTSLKTVPDNVQQVINWYRGQHNVPKFALVADDGSDTDSSGSYPVWRWADWQTHS